MPERIVFRDLAGMQMHKGGFGGKHISLDFGSIALDALSYATSEALLCALRGVIPLHEAQAVVETLLDHGLLADTLIEAELIEAELGE